VSSRTTEPETPPSGVLVVGDWLVDEHWMVGRHRSSTSNRTGRHHSRALHTDRCSVRSLCGAGQVATILHQAKYHGEPPFKLTGIGVWHPEDTASLAAMVDPGYNFGRTPHRLTAVPGKGESAPPVMHNLAAQATHVGTTRVIRIYENRPAGVDLLQRLDWELPLREPDTTRINRTAVELAASLRGISHIVVKDLRKGVITTGLVRALRKRFKKALWYVSSKEWDAPWLEELEPSALKLLFVPKIAAQRAILKRVIPSSWLTFSGPSKEALDALNALAKRFTAANIVIMPDDHHVLAYEPPPKAAEALGFALLAQHEKEPFFPFLPMASVFFPAIVAQLSTLALRAGPEEGALEPHRPAELLPILQDALTFTERWQAHERKRLSDPEWRPSQQQTLTMRDVPQRIERSGRWRQFGWSEADREWDMALQKLGLVTIADGQHVTREFQLWRGMTELPGYIACNPAKRLALSHIIREGRKLRETIPDERRHRSFLFVDVPGSGKSYMVDRLGHELGLEPKHFNVTRLTKKNEIFDWFHEIAAAQRSYGPPMLVFVDEINSKVDSQHIYDAFLEPLEDGKYVQGGSVWKLAPCLWIFAGTKDPAASRESDKGPDFESRLSHSVFHFHQPGKRESVISKVERVYVGVSCLLQRFPEVTRVSPPVLQAFYSLTDAVPREVRRFVWDFEEVQYSRVTPRNLPKEWRTRFAPAARKLYDAPDDERDLVEIKVFP
jgi:hypothetical protein